MFTKSMKFGFLLLLSVSFLSRRKAFHQSIPQHFLQMKRALTSPSASCDKESQGIKRRRSEPAKIKNKKSPQASEGEEDTEEGNALSAKSSTVGDRTEHVREPITPLPLDSFATKMKSLKIISWNVNGLKALVTSKATVLQSLIANHDPDILCLQETKIQESVIPDYQNLIPGYTSYWSCSTVKKGYSGTAVFLKNKSLSTSTKKSAKQGSLLSMWSKKTLAEPPAESSSASLSSADNVLTVQNISYDFEDVRKSFSGEGRTITIETEKFYLIACYVPNSGEGLNRLDYRINEWDPHMIEYMCSLNKKKPVILTGDLNVGHLDLDIHNPTAKHITKQAGLTPQERSSFTKILSETNSADAFRFYYPNAQGQFSYWSQRTFARPVNKGLRLDYFLCSDIMFPAKLQAVEDQPRTAVDYETLPSPGVYDSYILQMDTVGCSDHCPVVLVLKL